MSSPQYLESSDLSIEEVADAGISKTAKDDDDLQEEIDVEPTRDAGISARGGWLDSQAEHHQGMSANRDLQARQRDGPEQEQD